MGLVRGRAVMATEATDGDSSESSGRVWSRAPPVRVISRCRLLVGSLGLVLLLFL